MRNALSAFFICVACLIYGEVFLGTPYSGPVSSDGSAPECDRTGIAIGEPRDPDDECNKQASTSLPGPANAAPRPPEPDEVAITFQSFEGDGRAFLAYVKRDDASVFLQGNIAYIEERHERAIEDLGRELDLLFSEVFADSEQSIESYADWFFKWGQTWKILFEASLAGVSEISSGNMDQILGSMRSETEAYLVAGYLEHVLRAHERDPEIQEGIRKILERAEQDYQRMLSNLDERLIELIAEANLVFEMDNENPVNTFIDWETASLAAPASYGWNAALAGMGSLSLLAGSQLAAPLIEQVVISAMGPVVAEVLISAETVLGATALGSWVPGVGNLIGLAVGIAADYLLNEGREYLLREEFVKDSRQALEGTVTHWKAQLAPDLREIIEQWFTQSQATILDTISANQL